MATQSISGPSGHGLDPRPLFDLATGFMRAKHIFVAAELGVFETLGEGSATLEELAAKLGTPARTTRIVVDAVTALGLLERHSDRYRNNDLAQAYLNGRGIDMRPFLRFRDVRTENSVHLLYYHEDRTHLGLAKDTPASRPTEIRSARESKIQSFPRLGGLHHRYTVAT